MFKYGARLYSANPCSDDCAVVARQSSHLQAVGGYVKRRVMTQPVVPSTLLMA